jgi:large repetitive protein
MPRFIAVRFFGMALVSLLAASCGGSGDSGPSRPVISADAPSGTTGVAYPAFAFTVTSGGTAPFTWSETGALPPGLLLSLTGQLSGTPAQAGTFPVTVTVTDSSNPALTASMPASLKIADSPILISTAPPPPATVTCPYAGFTFMASGGSPGYTWTATADAVPAGLTLSPDGSLSGTPTTAGSFTFTVTATDSAQAPVSKSQPFKVIVDPQVNTLINTPVNTLTGGGAFWIPYMATPVSSPSCGQTGVFVIPSDALTTAPTYVTTSANTMVLDSGLKVTLNGNNVVSAYSPATLMFAATDANNNIHVYGLNLLSESTPAAAQISSLSLPLAAGTALSAVICDFHGSSSNLLQPTTAFVVLHIAGATGCNTSGDVWEVVHYTDSPATAPALVSITTTNIQELYAPGGDLAGLLLLDSASGNLHLYANTSFTAPATPIPGGIASVGVVYSNNNVAASGTVFAGTVLFLAVTTSGGTQFLYRLPYTDTIATSEYPLVGGVLGNAVSDGTNLYFTDNASPPLILQEPLVGGAPTTLYSYTGGGNPYSLVGSNGSLLVMSTSTSVPVGRGFLWTSDLATLPVGTLSGNTTALGGPIAGYATPFMVNTTPGTPSTALAFVSAVPGWRPVPNQRFAYSSEVLTPSGTVKQGGRSISSFINGGTGALSGYVLQLEGVCCGPWTLSALNLQTLASTPLQTPAGASYTLPLGEYPVVAALSNFIGAGAYAILGAGAYAGQGFAYDLSKDLIVPIAIANTTVAPF